MKNSLSDVHFPLEKIIDRYKGSNKDLRFDDEYIESLLNIRYGEGRCRALLHLLFPEMNPTEVFHIDHLHPRNHFSNKYLEKIRLYCEFTGETQLLRKSGTLGHHT